MQKVVKAQLLKTVNFDHFTKVPLTICHALLAIIFLVCLNNQAVIQAMSQPAFTCSKLTIETLEQGAKYVQS